MRILAIIAVLLGLSGVSRAQTITPLVTEFNLKPGKSAKGSFKIQNNALLPVSFTVTASGFSVDSTGRHLKALLPSERVSTSETSGRLSAKEIREIFYTVTCDQACNIVFRPALVVGKTFDGVIVKVYLDSSVYIAQSKHPRRDVLSKAGFVVAK